MESESDAVSRVKAAAAQYLRWGSLIAMIGAAVVAGSCDGLLFYVYPATGGVLTSLVFVLAMIFCGWSICVIAFERRRVLLRLAVNSARWRLGDQQERPAPVLTLAHQLDADRL